MVTTNDDGEESSNIDGHTNLTREEESENYSARNNSEKGLNAYELYEQNVLTLL